MADEQTSRTIPAHVMAMHFDEKAKVLEGVAISRLADRVAFEAEVAHCHGLIAKLQADLQSARETIAQRDEEIARLDALRPAEEPQE